MLRSFIRVLGGLSILIAEKDGEHSKCYCVHHHNCANSKGADLLRTFHCSRPIVDPETLNWALKNDQIAAAALNINDPEPLSLDDKLLDLPNLIIAPHIASATIASRTLMAKMAVRSCIAGVQGKPLPFPVNTV